MTEHKVLSIRMPIDIYRELEKMAKEERRSMSRQAVYYIEKQMVTKLIANKKDRN